MNPLIAEIFTEQMSAWVAQRQEPFGFAVAREKSRFIRAGAGGSSREGFAIRQVYSKEFEEIAAEGWRRLHRIALHIGVEPSEGLAVEIKSVLANVLNARAKEMAEARGNDGAVAKAANTKIVAEAHEAFNTSIALRNSEIDLFANSAALGQGSNSGIVFQQYNAPVGTVQTGERSAAVVHQEIGAMDFTAIAEALGALKLEAASNEAVVSAIETAESELAKPEPDQSRIAAMLSTVVSMGKKIGYQTAAGVATAAAMAGLGL